MKYLNILAAFLLTLSFSYAQTISVIPGAQVVPQRNLTSGMSTNVSVLPISTNGQQFINFALTNPVTFTLGTPDNAPWDTTFGYNSATDTIGLSATWLADLAADFADVYTYTDTQVSAIALTPGPQGIQGVKGDTGTAGTNGTNGADGAVGPKGDTGNTGSTGATGAAGADAVLSFSTTGSGAASYNGTTKSLNVPTPSIPTNTNQLTNGAGFITGINSGNVTTALGFTPYNATNPNGYTANTGTVTSVGVTSSNLTITGSPVTASSSITVSLPNVGTAGTYGTVTTDAQGRVTAGKRVETYSGTSAATTGAYTVSFGTAYSVAPNIQANIINPSDTQSLKITAVSTTGFTVIARNRTDVVGLLPAFSNASGLPIDVLITEK